MSKAIKKVLVVGGSGFLGSHVADALSDHGYEVTIFDLTPSPFLKENQKQIEGTILDLEAINQAVKNCDAVYNFGGIADLDRCHNNPLETVNTNILGHTHILEAATKHKIKKVLFASSVYVHSRFGSFYRISKQTSEQLTEAYGKRFDIPYVILRYGSLYGERADDRNSIFRMLKEAVQTGVINFAGEGSEKREFIHVRDAAELSVKALADEHNSQNLILTGKEAITYEELLGILQEMFETPIKINRLGRQTETHYRLTPYSFHPKVGKKFVNNPSIDLGQGLVHLIGELHQHFQNNEKHS